MNEIYYKQCELRSQNGNAYHIAWIPAALAKIGQWLEIKKTKEDWQVVKAGNNKRTKKDLNKKSIWRGSNNI